MAKMYPKNFFVQSHKTGVIAESEVYKALKEGLPDEYHCFHSFRIPRSFDKQNQDREVDFLIAHPEQGITAIEVKADKIFFDNDIQKLMQTKKDANYTSYHKPRTLDIDNQIRNTVNSFKQYVSKSIDMDPYVSELWAFPHTGKLEGNLPEFVINKSLTTNDLHNIGVTLPKRITGKPLQKDRFKKLIEFLDDQYQINRSKYLKEVLKGHREIISESSEQNADDQVDRWFSDENMAIIGGAGSGKTQLIIEKAERLYIDKKKTLVTCYNELIEESLRNTLAPFSEFVTVLNFHHLACHFLKINGGIPPEPNDQKDKRKYFEEDIPDLFDKVLKERAGPESKFDAILVDEGQDFTFFYWECLRSCFKDSKEAQLVVAIDPSQKARDGQEKISLDEIFGDLLYVPERLKYNWRNTQAITNYSNCIFEKVDEKFILRGKEYSVLALEPHPDFPEGQKVHESVVKNQAELTSKLSEILCDLVEKCQIPTSSITLLTEKGQYWIQDEKNPLHYQQKIGDYTLQTESTSKKTIQLETVRRFKGRENLVVIVIAGEKMNDALKYIACTRASTLLYVIDAVKVL
jgi:hypothetical protein